MSSLEPAPLPAYEPLANLPSADPSLRSPPPQTPARSLVAAGNPDLNTASFIGGGGARIPLSTTEKEREDLRSLSHLASYGVQVWVRGFDEYVPLLFPGTAVCSLSPESTNGIHAHALGPPSPSLTYFFLCYHRQRANCHPQPASEPF